MYHFFVRKKSVLMQLSISSVILDRVKKPNLNQQFILESKPLRLKSHTIIQFYNKKLHNPNTTAKQKKQLNKIIKKEKRKKKQRDQI